MKNIIVSCLVLISSSICYAGDVTQWRGEERTGIYPEKGLIQTWDAKGPELLLKVKDCGEGYSSPIVVDGVIYITGNQEKNREKLEYMHAIDEATGKKLWSTQYGLAWNKTQYTPSRSTPTYSNGEIFVISGQGEVVALNAKSGKINWKVNAKKDFQGVNGSWGTAESPLLIDDLVIFTPGGKTTTMVALSRKDGKEVWRSKPLDDNASYVSPILINHKGIQQIVGGTVNNIFSINPKNGEFLWHTNINKMMPNSPKVNRYDILANTPLYFDGKIFLSNGYNQGSFCMALNDTSDSYKLLWENYDLCSQHHGYVLIDDVIYSSTHHYGKWAAIDAKTGKTLYNEKNSKLGGQGQIIAADGVMYVYTHPRGALGVIKPNKEKLEVLATSEIKEGKGEHWCHPIIANKKLFLRRGDILFVYNLGAK